MKTILIVPLAVLFAAGPALASLPSADPADPRPVPVIDMHTHVFNARDLPIRGVVRTRLRGVFASHIIAGAIKAVLQPPHQDGEEDFGSPGKSEAELNTLLHAQPAQKLDFIQRYYLEKYVAENRPAFRVESLEKDAATANIDPDTQLALEALEISGALSELDHGGEQTVLLQGQKEMVTGGLSLGILQLAKLLRQHRLDIVQRMTCHTYRDADLFVHHMMDMQRAYDDKPPLVFEDQVKLFKRIDEQAKGRLLRFVAYDPFRGEDALGLVQRAWTDGAGGVKFYPSSGYSPTGNPDPQFPPWWNLWQFWERRRLRSAYGDTTGRELDETIARFLGWAAANQVPVFSHTDQADMSPRGDYWEKGDPLLWRKLMENDPTGTLRRVRLCFAHGGGDDYWTSNPDKDAANAANPSWRFGAEIVKMCREYPNVYLELGCLQGVMTAAGREAIIKRLAHDLKPTATAHQLGDKIMYGTDWHMLAKTPRHEEYLDNFDRVISSIDQGKWRRKFFAGNAAEFLQLDRLAKDPRFAAQRQHWETILAGAK